MIDIQDIIGQGKLASLEKFDYGLLPETIIENMHKSEVRQAIYHFFHEWGYFAECIQLMSKYPTDKDVFNRYWEIATTLGRMFFRDRLILSNNKQNIICGRYTYSIAGSPEFCFLPEVTDESKQTASSVHRIVIGKFSGIAPGVKILCGGNHQINSLSTFPFWHKIFENCGWDFPLPGHLSIDPFRECGLSKGPVTIGNDVWIGQDVTILSGSSIPNGCVIGARSVVSGDLDPYGIYVGNPARLVRYRQIETVVNKLERLAWWDLPLSEVKKLAPYLCSLNITTLHRS